MYVPCALVAKFPPSVPCHDGDREIVQEADGREEEQQSTICSNLTLPAGVGAAV